MLLIRKNQKIIFSQNKQTIFFISIFLSVPTFFSVISIALPKLNQQVIGTNLGSVVSLFVVVSSFILLYIFNTRKVFEINLQLFFPILTLTTFAVISGIILGQSWLAPLGILIIQLLALTNQLTKSEIWISGLYSLLSISTELLVLSIFFPIFENCRSDKCFVFPQVFSTSIGGNGLGLDLFSLIILVIFLSEMSLFDKWIFIISSGLLLLNASSRTGLFSFLFVVHLFAFKNLYIKFRLLPLLFWMIVAYTLFPIWGTYSEKSFTERGYLWIYAKSLAGEAGITGLGTSYWTRLGTSHGFPSNYGTHNIWLDTLIAFGVIGLILFVWILVNFGLKCPDHQLKLLFLSALFTGMNESTLIIWKMYPNSILLILMLMNWNLKEKNMVREYRI